MILERIVTLRLSISPRAVIRERLLATVADVVEGKVLVPRRDL